MELFWFSGWSIRRVVLWLMISGCILCILKYIFGVSFVIISFWIIRFIWGILSIIRIWCWWRGRWWIIVLLVRCGFGVVIWGRCLILLVLIICMLMYLNFFWLVLRNLRYFLVCISFKKSILGFFLLWFFVIGIENIVLNEGFFKFIWG